MTSTKFWPSTVGDLRYEDVATPQPAGPAARSTRLRVALSTIGTFHTFDMARQLEKAGALVSIHTGYPRFKLKSTSIPSSKIRTFPWLVGPYMAGWVPSGLRREWEYWNCLSFEHFVARTLPECDVYCGLSASGLRAGRVAQRRGARYVCDRGSAHIRLQDAILREEYQRWGIPFRGIDPRIIEREEQEYAQADAILVPSQFAYRSFVQRGFNEEKLHLAPYGVDLSRFERVDTPRKGGFDVLFVGSLSVQKGIPYLFKAFEGLQHPAKSLTFAGPIKPEIVPLLKEFTSRNRNIRILGHVPQHELKNLMSRSHVLALPSVHDGFGMVQAQAMACACPVVASSHTGAQDLFDNGIEGLIVEACDFVALNAALQKLADDPSLRENFAHAARQRVARMGGWDRYGKIVLEVFRDLANVPFHAVDASGTVA